MSTVPPAVSAANNIKIATGWLREGITITKDERTAIEARIADLVKRLDEVTK